MDPYCEQGDVVVGAGQLEAQVQPGRRDVGGRALLPLADQARSGRCLLGSASGPRERRREELRRHPSKHDAMAQALRTAGPAIVASGCTVIAALLCLSIAEVDGTDEVTIAEFEEAVA